MLTIMEVLHEGYYSKMPAWGRILTEKEIEISTLDQTDGLMLNCISDPELINPD